MASAPFCIGKALRAGRRAGIPDMVMVSFAYLAALAPAMRPTVKHIMMEVPEAGYSL